MFKKSTKLTMGHLSNTNMGKSSFNVNIRRIKPAALTGKSKKNSRY